MATMALTFPQSLADKYRPRQVSGFLGLEKPKKIMAKFSTNPRAAAFLFSVPAARVRQRWLLRSAKRFKAS